MSLVADITEFTNQPWKLKVSAVMSAPRLGFIDNFQSGLDSFNYLRIRLKIAQGAFWGQKLQAAMEQEMDRDQDAIITCDYDSIFNAMHVLAVLDGLMQGYDCVVPMQVKRHDQEPMPFYHPTQGFMIAHFGLTGFKVEALKRMPKPFFIETPGGDGGWNGDHEDGDVYFWRKWQEIGNTIGRLPTVAIGHLESMVMWPGVGGRGARAQRAQNFFENGAPEPWTLKMEAPT